MELTAGMKLGIFTIVKQIGAGGMSEVYLVKDDLGRPFALKTMSRSLSFEPSFRQRFEQEARIMASLSHPNIVQMHSYFEADGRFCLVMEYIEGGSLRELSRKIGPIPEKRALHILQQIAEALSYAHGKGIIHRDIKPSNILLDENDNVKVMDFGIARMTEGPGLTQTGSQMGTLVYMSPEQIRDSKHVDERTDIYSLGVSFYEMLTGKPPYDEQNSSDFDIRVSIVQDNLPDPRKIYPYISDESLLLLDGLTQKERDQRFPLSALISDELPETHRTTTVAKPKPVLEKKHEVSSLYQAVHQTTIDTNMIFVQGGSFQMGSADSSDNQKPVHEVRVSSFWIGKYQITQKEWVEVMGKNPSEYKGDRLPVQNVSWYDAVEYCNKRSIREGLTPCYSYSSYGTNPANWPAGWNTSDYNHDNVSCDWNALGYRLPTEEEWEYAARGGLETHGYTYSGSNDIDEVAWYSGNKSSSGTKQVGSKLPNELGIYDISGNVWEWCWDIYRGACRVVRGGSWFNFASNCAVSYRSGYGAALSGNDLGFRVCRVSP